jgi:HK97 family phage prohead protease
MTAADFSGYATRNDLRCSDGRTIIAGAFEENDGQTVPLVWQHGHDEATNVLGHVKLENRSDGVYCHAYFNSTAAGQHAKEMVRHGDVKYLSIFANQLVEKVRDRASNIRDVLKGNIREVSLVLAGANPGAEIDNVNIVHGDGDFTRIAEEAYITTGLEIELPSSELVHSDDSDTSLEVGGELSHESAMDILDSLDEKQKTAVFYLLSQALTVGDSVQHSDIDGDSVVGADEAAEGDGEGEESESTEAASESSDSEEGEGEESESVEGEGEESESVEGTDDSESSDGEGEESESEDAAQDTEDGGAVQHADTNQEDNSMTHNVFDQAKKGAAATRQQASLSHDAVKSIVADAVNNTGSLKRSLENYVAQNGITVDGTLQHGIENIDYLFPDAKTLESSPAFISRRMEWVDKVLSSVRKSPFSRIKTITADITPDEARARGYIKGNMKNEEYFALAKRETTPQTIYKKQKLDRDDVIDIVDLDVVAWLKAEMKVMLDEELAGAILVGDGRSIGDDDKIKETNIRPIASDAELYVTTVNVNLADASSSVEELVDAVINNRQYYKGTGQPTFYTTENIISKFLTVKDNFGRRIYSNLAEVAAVLRVADIVPVEVMERVPDVAGIMVNLADYTLGADRGGQATMFDDFDIDYNKLRYLIETRCSGALTQPKAALVFRTQAGSAVLLADPTEPTFDGTTVTVPTVSNVTYKDGEGNTLTTASPVTLADGESIHVKATANSGYYFADNVHDEWDYENPA